MGERRLVRLSEEFDVHVERRFLEIHPETPAEGRPVSELGYPPEQWARMMENLERMGKAEGIVFSERTFTTNSHKALLLAEAAGVPAGRLEQAWSDATYEERLASDHAAATEMGITGIPVFIVDGRWILEGAVPVEMLRETAKRISAGSS